MNTTHRLSEFELRRLKNIEDNKRVLALLNQDLKNFGVKLSGQELLDATKKAPAARKPAVKRREKTTRSTLVLAQYSPPRTRSRRAGGSQGSSRSTSPDGQKRLVVKFGFGARKNAATGSDDENSEDEVPVSRRRYLATDSRTADQITDEDLSLVANCFGDKIYDSFAGSSCHQCRQKTHDQKTICRSGDCVGVRGQFCGPCLKIRYGEDAREALKEPSWSCPPCRGICNCSFCRKRAGRSCTGILIHLARAKGYDDVNSYLQGLQLTSELPMKPREEPMEPLEPQEEPMAPVVVKTEDSTVCTGKTEHNNNQVSPPMDDESDSDDSA